MNETNNDIFLVSFEASKHSSRKYTKPTPSAIKVMEHYVALCRHLKINRFRRSLKTIAEATGLNRKTVYNSNECLRQLGFLKWERGGGNGPKAACFPNVYTVNPSVFGLPGWDDGWREGSTAGRLDNATTGQHDNGS